jgi:hypothetical protein
MNVDVVVTLAPPTQLLATNGVAHLTYTGPATRLGAIYFDGQLLDFGAMDDALSTGDVIDLPWAWFGDTVSHRLEFRVYAGDYAVEGAEPAFTDPYVVSASVIVEAFANVTTFAAPDLGELIVGQSVNVTIDLGTLTSGFDWSFGGSLDTAGLPAGLAASLANPSTDDDQWSDDGSSPQLRVSGTPTTTGQNAVIFAVADGMNASAVVTHTYDVAALPKPPVSPPGRTLVGAGKSTFTIAGLGSKASIKSDALVRGLKSFSATPGTVTLTTLSNFSGVVRQRITVTDRGLVTSLTLVLVVKPAAPTHVNFTVMSKISRTLVRWNPSANATGYRVLVNGKNVAAMARTARTYTFKGALSVHTAVHVVALGGDGLTSPATKAAFAR